MAPARVAAARLLLPVTGMPGGSGGPGAPRRAGRRRCRCSGRSPTARAACRSRRARPRCSPTTASRPRSPPAGASPGWWRRSTAPPRSAARPPPRSAWRSTPTCSRPPSDMSGGYEVRTPDGSVPGTGAAAAGAWLASVRDAARGRCVLALPYADADLLATSRGNMSDLTTAARTLGERRIADLLGVRPGARTPPRPAGRPGRRAQPGRPRGRRRPVARRRRRDAGRRGPPGRRRPVRRRGRRPPRWRWPPIRSPGEALAPRPAASDAFDEPGGHRRRARDAGRARRRHPARPRRGPAPRPTPRRPCSPRPPTGPPTRTRPRPCSPVSGTSPGAAWSRPSTPGPCSPPVRRADRRCRRSRSARGTGWPSPTSRRPILDEIRGVRDDQRDLLAASRQDHTGAPTPSDFVEPLTGALLRSLSAAGRGDPALQRAAADDVAAQMRTLRGMVHVVQPGGELLARVERRAAAAHRREPAAGRGGRHGRTGAHAGGARVARPGAPRARVRQRAVPGRPRRRAVRAVHRRRHRSHARG